MKNIVEADRPHDNIIRRMGFACWIPKVTNTRSQYAIHLVFLLQQ